MLLLHTAGSTRVSEVRRYTITYTPEKDRILPLPSALHLRIKNTASLPLRAAYLHGPYTLYVSVRRQEFQPWVSTTPGTNERDSELAEELDRSSDAHHQEGGVPVYDPHLKAGASFYTTLPLPADLLEESRQAILESQGPTSPRRRAFEHGGQHSLDGTRHFEEKSLRKRKSVTWIVEIVSQVIFSASATVGYEVLLGRDEKSLSFGFPLSSGKTGPRPTSALDEDGSVSGVMSGAIKVKLQDTRELWNLPAFPTWEDPEPDAAERELDPEEQEEARRRRWRRKAKRRPRKVHLVVLTHGLHSNTGADMLFMKEAIDEEERKADVLRKARRKRDISDGKISEEDEDDSEQVIVRGYQDNVCKTERGIKYLGKRLAKFVLHLCDPKQNPMPAAGPKKLQKKSHHHPHLTAESHLPKQPEPSEPAYKITSISFIGHSLGGLVQTYAIAYIHAHSPNFFRDIKPVNFVTLATPFLGLSNENPLYVKFALDFGLVGRTGQDLGLSWRAPSAFSSAFGQASNGKANDAGIKPLLRILPTGPAHEVLKRFRNRTVYANVVNDGIVPLRTSCLLFLDWRGLGRVEKARRENTVGGLVEWGWGQLVTTNNYRSPPVTPSRTSFTDLNTAKNIVDSSSSSATAREDNPVSEAPHTNEPTSREIERRESHHEELDSHTTAPNPFTSLVTLFRPQAGTKKQQGRAPKIYHRSQTCSPGSPASPSPERSPSYTSNPGVSASPNLTDSEGQREIADLLAPPKTTILEAAGDVLNPPLPTTEFLVDPKSRPRTIFHDRIYHPTDIPPAPTERSTTSTLMPCHHGERESEQQKAELKVEEKIARAYHRNLSWRKVLVRLEPDAHNNLIVRRMFANAYGWPVVQHVVETHFGLSSAALTADDDESGGENAVIAGGEDAIRKTGRAVKSDSQQRAHEADGEETPRRRRSTTMQSTSSTWSERAFEVTDDESEETVPTPHEREHEIEQFLGLQPGLKKPGVKRADSVSGVTTEVARGETLGLGHGEGVGTAGLGLGGWRGSWGPGGGLGALKRMGSQHSSGSAESTGRSEAIRALERCKGSPTPLPLEMGEEERLLS